MHCNLYGTFIVKKKIQLQAAMCSYLEFEQDTMVGYGLHVGVVTLGKGCRGNNLKCRSVGVILWWQVGRQAGEI